MILAYKSYINEINGKSSLRLPFTFPMSWIICWGGFGVCVLGSNFPPSAAFNQSI
jgi:hypothetical protein